MALQIKKATRDDILLRVGIAGLSGSGKTYTGIGLSHILARALELPSKILVIDTEFGSAAKYAGLAPYGYPWEYDVLSITDDDRYSPSTYVKALRMAANEGYPFVVVDSLSHAWEGEGGALDMQQKAGGRFQDWKDVTPLQNEMVRRIVSYPGHIICTMRSKVEYALDTSQGRASVQKVGLAPIQRKGLEYEFDIFIDIDQQHIATVSKSRCAAFQDKTTQYPDDTFFKPLIDWVKGDNSNPTQLLKTIESKKAEYDTNKTIPQDGASFVSAMKEQYGVNGGKLVTMVKAELGDRQYSPDLYDSLVEKVVDNLDTLK